MANIKSAVKRDLNSKKTNVANNSRKNEIRTATKKLETLVAEGKKDEALKALPEVISLIDRAAGDKIFARNTASRKKARLQRLVASLA